MAAGPGSSRLLTARVPAQGSLKWPSAIWRYNPFHGSQTAPLLNGAHRGNVDRIFLCPCCGCFHTTPQASGSVSAPHRGFHVCAGSFSGGARVQGRSQPLMGWTAPTGICTQASLGSGAGCCPVAGICSGISPPDSSPGRPCGSSLSPGGSRPPSVQGTGYLMCRDHHQGWR